MKKILVTLILAVISLIGTSAFIIQNKTGIVGYSGSPGESTCNHCHGPGSTPGITVSVIADFSVSAGPQTEYLPDSVYQIIIKVSAAGFTRYGFASQILDVNNVNAGNLQNPGSGVKFLNSGGKRTAVHTTPKINAAGTVTFTYKWTAPTAGSSDATIYAIANAVNGNDNTSGDLVVSPISIVMTEGTPPPPPPDTTGLEENAGSVSQIVIFPVPAKDITNISYYLKQARIISIELIDIKGKQVKELYKQDEFPGLHTQILSLQGVSPGVYFIKTSANGQKVSQKLITVQ